jgi:hypothetical protein
VGGLGGAKLDLKKLSPKLSAKLRGVDALLSLKGDAVWLMAPYRVEVE